MYEFCHLPRCKCGPYSKQCADGRNKKSGEGLGLSNHIIKNSAFECKKCYFFSRGSCFLHNMDCYNLSGRPILLVTILWIVKWVGRYEWSYFG